MSSLEPKIDFETLDDAGLGIYGLAAAAAAFSRNVQEGFTNGDSLVIVIGCVDSGRWRKLGEGGIGSDAAKFLPKEF